MSSCTCGTHESEASEPVEEIKEAPEAVEALEEPVREEDLNKEDELTKDLEQTLGKLKEVMAYLAEMAEDKKMMDDEKMDHDDEKMDHEKAEHEEDEDEDEEEEDEKGMHDKKPKAKEDSLEKSLATLKKYGFNVYSGSKATPAPKEIETPKAKYDFNDLVNKSWEELERLERGN
jgi:septal ring factor EnvC (AmiA/AmiB activator)